METISFIDSNSGFHLDSLSFHFIVYGIFFHCLGIVHYLPLQIVYNIFSGSDMYGLQNIFGGMCYD